MLNYLKDGLLPPHDVHGMKLYMENGVEPGSFLYAVLCNNLRAACMAADSINIKHLAEIVTWLYNEAPATSWGSPEVVSRWIDAGGTNGTYKSGRVKIVGKNGKDHPSLGS